MTTAGGSTVRFLQHSNQLFEHPGWTKGTDSWKASGWNGSVRLGEETSTPPDHDKRYAFCSDAATTFCVPPSTPNSVGKSCTPMHWECRTGFESGPRGRLEVCLPLSFGRGPCGSLLSSQYSPWRLESSSAYFPRPQDQGLSSEFLW